MDVDHCRSIGIILTEINPVYLSTQKIRHFLFYFIYVQRVCKSRFHDTNVNIYNLLFNKK